MGWRRVKGMGDRMRAVGFAVVGMVLGAGLGLFLSWPQRPTGLDPQGLHLIGVLFVALPVGAVAGLVSGLLLARFTRR